MRRYVSVPEKTLEHWTSQYINNRFSTRAALWWPTAGQDIDVRHLPASPGKAVQLELKTTTVTGPTKHEVLVDLVQLADYGRLPPGRQPFYVFPWPDWCGELEEDAAAFGPPVSELAFSRSGPGWWFADWMVAMTTGQVTEVLATELKRHGSNRRRKKSSLVQFEVTVSGTGRPRSTKATWGPRKITIDPPPVIHWIDLWTELLQCGREGWPQLIFPPAWMIKTGRAYSYDEVAGMLRNIPEELPVDDTQDRKVPLVTLEPDDEGNYVATRVGDARGRVDEDTAVVGRHPEVHRTVVFLGVSGTGLVE
jgi:hypothetical protein